MDRRSALKNLAIASAGTLLWAGCKESYVNVLSLYHNGRLNLDDQHLSYLDTISETFLPVGELKDELERPSTFMMRMINDLRSPREVLKFTQGFEAFKTFIAGAQLKIMDADPKLILGLVKELIREDPPFDDLLGFIQTVRGYSIWNLKSSEHYLTEYQEYAMVPPPYDGKANV